jgi:hypothetical protein
VIEESAPKRCAEAAENDRRTDAVVGEAAGVPPLAVWV